MAEVNKKANVFLEDISLYRHFLNDDRKLKTFLMIARQFSRLRCRGEIADVFLANSTYGNNCYWHRMETEKHSFIDFLFILFHLACRNS